MGKAPSFKLPLLALHGGDDIICLPAGSLEFFQRAGTAEEDKTHIVYKGLMHEIFNEPDKTPVRDVVAWLEKMHSRLPSLISLLCLWICSLIANVNASMYIIVATSTLHC